MRTVLRSLIPALCFLLLTAPARADFDAGMAAYELGEFETAMTEWLPIAEAGDAEAQFRVGRLFSLGEGVEESDANAFKWFLKASEQEHPTATYYLSVYYYHGYAAPEDRQIALTFSQKAAELGDLQSAAVLGRIYLFGDGVPQDDEEAAKWLRTAAERGHEGAQYYLASMYFDGRAMAKSEKQAFYWFYRAARQGLSPAQVRLGACYRFGEGVDENLIEAYKWALLSTSTGNWRGYLSLFMYWFETTIPQRNEARWRAKMWRPVKEQRPH